MAGDRAGSKGFALVISLAMMALMVLLLVSLSALLQIQVQAGSQQKKEGVAKQNALLAVILALSDLQQHGGPDQRVTARADLLDEDALHRHWTGVWHADPSGGGTPFESGQPRWLVSTESATPNPINENLVNPVVLVGADSWGENEVVADRVSIAANNGSVSGDYAYWVGDEGIKVNMLAREPDAYKETSNTDYSGQVHRLSMAHQPRWEQLLGSGIALDSHTHSNLRSFDQLELLGDDLPVSEYFHDISAYSSGLLTNTAEGGFKKDLTRILTSGFTGDYPDSLPIVSGAGFPDPPTWGLLRSFYNAGNDDSLGTSWGDLSSPVNVRAHSFSDHIHGIFPIVGMWQMNWGARYNAADNNRVQITIIPVVTLVNPYNVSLAPTTYRLRLNWRPGSMQNLEGEDGSAVPTPNSALMISWNQPIANNANYDVAPYIHQDVHGDAGIELEFADVSFAPGEARIFTIAGQHHYIPGVSQPLPMTPGFNLVGVHASLDFTPETYLTASQIAGEFWFRMRWASVNAVLSADVASNSSSGFREVQRIEQPLYITSRTYSLPNKNPLFIGFRAAPNRIQLRHSNHGVLQHNTDQTSGTRWMALYNPRAAVSGRDRAPHSWSGQPLYDGFVRAANVNDVQHDPSTGQGYWGGDNQPGDGQHFVPLYDIPRQPLVSLGGLQHANLSSQSWQPSYPFANSWASPYYEYNEEDLSYALNQALWDNYFFSGLEDGLTNWPLPDEWHNTRLRPLEQAVVSDALDAEQAAVNLSLLGAFNINSTSVPAWKSLLRSLQGRSVPYNDPAAGSGLTSDDTGDTVPFPRSGLSASTGNTMWRGFPALTDGVINELAEAIVTEIRNRGPFRSLAEFVNRDLGAPRGSEANLKGTLQAAIDNTSINLSWAAPVVPETQDAPVNQYPEASAGPRSSAAPGYLTQADLLSVLGPVLTARSDTFLIRGYGNTIRPGENDIDVEVWCEAVFQRVPEFVDADEESITYPPSRSINEIFGRKYKLVTFRWLKPDEI